MNKYKHRIPKEDLKRFGKEISKKLVAADYKAGRVTDPTKIDDKQKGKVKDYCKQYFDRAAHKHKKAEAEKKTKGTTNTSTPTAMSPATDQDFTPMKKEESDDEDVKMSDHEDTPSERSTLKRKRGDSSPVVKTEDRDKSPHKKLNVNTPPPPPPPAPPIETPPATTPDDGMEVEADLHDEGDTMFRDKSMADVQALAQQEGMEDEEMISGDPLDQHEES